MVTPYVTPYTKSVSHKEIKRVKTMKASLLSKDMIKKRDGSLITSSQDFVALQKPEKEKIDVTKTLHVTTTFNFKAVAVPIGKELYKSQRGESTTEVQI